MPASIADVRDSFRVARRRAAQRPATNTLTAPDASWSPLQPAGSSLPPSLSPSQRSAERWT